MAEIVKMPKLSDTMTEGVVAEWHKKVGDQVESGELLAEIETDKATMEFESFQDGVLLHIGVEKGDTAPVDSILAILGDEGEDVSQLIKDFEANFNSDSSADTQEEEAPKAEPVETKKEDKPASTPAPAPASTGSSTTSNGRIKSSPLARKLAEEKGIDIAQVSGSGEDGRIVKRDIENFKPSSVSGGVSVSSQSYRDEKISQMRKTIARRLSESKFEAPHFYLSIDVDMAKAVAARADLKERLQAKFSFNDLVIKASALALKKHPEINASWLGDTIRYYDYTNVGVAVAVPDGLLVPVVKNADQKGLTEIGEEVRELATKAKDKKLQPSEMEGNTFTISNLGMFGIDEFTAIINPPDACILAVGTIRDVPVVEKGQIVPGKRMKLTLSCDHRVVDGAKGASFLNTLKNYMEEPLSILL